MRLSSRRTRAGPSYLRRFYGIDRELPTDYDLVVNTDILTTEARANWSSPPRAEPDRGRFVLRCRGELYNEPR